MTKEEIKDKIYELIPEIDISMHGCGNANRESHRYVMGKIFAYCDVLGIDLDQMCMGTTADIQYRLRESLSFIN